MVFGEILAGSLRLQAQRLIEMSRSNPEPNGLQARAQVAKGESLLDWSRAEKTAAESNRDFDAEKLSREEVAWAIRFAEQETERLMSLFVELHEQEHGPIGDLATALEQDGGEFEATPEMDKTIKRWSKYEEALFEMRSLQRALWGDEEPK